MPNEEVILTAEGLAQLEAELDDLKYVKRKELAERIKIALSYGDLRENSEYHSAKEDQAFMETRILTIERILRNARVVDANNMDSSVVNIGSTVVLNDVEFAEKIDYQIVGSEEANVAENKISYESPLGKALIGKKVGDVVQVDAPAGMVEYELLEIKSKL
ncbi:transcription elongation factor GreA [Cohnella zeiphila]|uniref:Transcription elongation factor GreA n=1 Tax=Cohnella zeiphila TaxID=2761120 RepID=A0A7X0SLZ7_9BACL|nr:transcription elongation factor GreA [Cohnella zeiphila]